MRDENQKELIRRSFVNNLALGSAGLAMLASTEKDGKSRSKSTNDEAGRISQGESLTVSKSLFCVIHLRAEP
jgi:hypothetical protein